MKRISLIGSTGSIGRQVCSVVARYPEQFKIVALVANSSAELFLEQVLSVRPEYAVLVDERAAEGIRDRIPQGVRFACGKAAALDAVSLCDTAFVAATGFAGLAYSLRAIQEKKDIALANKETLVCGGELVIKESKGAGVRLLPVDSEHSALWQALSFRADAPFKRLILTASGGPFYGYDKQELALVTPERALKHPTWQMGAKITIDSATLLNKGFEVIEARWLYDAPLSKIHTVVHPESIIHSMVEFEDSAVMAQMSYPSMELPIQLALTYPKRQDCALKPLDFEALGALHFKPLRREDFPCYDLALYAAERGGSLPCALNGAGEVAVHAFLEKKISFLQIAEVIEEVLSSVENLSPNSYGALLTVDGAARAKANEIIKKRTKY